MPTLHPDYVAHEPLVSNELRFRTLTDVECTRKYCDEVVAEGGVVWRFKSTPDFFCSKECRATEVRRLKQREYRRKNPDWHRNNHLMQKYGLTPEEWDALYDQQLGRCAICLKTFAEDRPHTDHCHETGKVRGLLCGTCNTGVGMLGDDPDVLRRAADYVEEA